MSRGKCTSYKLVLVGRVQMVSVRIDRFEYIHTIYQFWGIAQGVSNSCNDQAYRNNGTGPLARISRFTVVIKPLTINITILLEGFILSLVNNY